MEMSFRSSYTSQTRPAPVSKTAASRIAVAKFVDMLSSRPRGKHAHGNLTETVGDAYKDTKSDFFRETRPYPAMQRLKAPSAQHQSLLKPQEKSKMRHYSRHKFRKKLKEICKKSSLSVFGTYTPKSVAECYLLLKCRVYMNGGKYIFCIYTQIVRISTQISRASRKDQNCFNTFTNRWLLAYQNQLLAPIFSVSDAVHL